jgi:starch synthase
VLFQKAVVAFFEKNNITPRLVHCHDAPTALVPALAKAAFSGRFSQTKFITTIHNAGQGYHHEFGSVDEAARFTGIDRNMLAKALNSGRVEPYLLAAQYGELTTVSPWYAEELLANRVPDYSGGLTDCFRAQKIHITGITNGITVEKYDPRYTEKSKLPFAFDPASGDIAGKYECRAFLAERTNACAEKHVESMQQFGTLAPRHDDEKRCLFVYHGRIARQKGINVLICAIDILLSRGEAKAFIVCGQGEAQLENELVALAKKYPGKCVYFRGYDKRLVRLVTAAADFIVLPSDFEPCCLEDFIAQLFGTIPVAHSTGGLQKILHGKTGFLYDDNSPAALAAVLSKLGADFCENRQKYEKIMRFAAAYVKSAYSWNTIIEKYYLPLYQSP